MGLMQLWCIDMDVNRTVPPVLLASWLYCWPLFLIHRFPLFFATTRAGYSCALFPMFYGLKNRKKCEDLVRRHKKLNRDCVSSPKIRTLLWEASPAVCSPNVSFTTTTHCG